jgi:RimJ/RimL family protein N-acetyltransferase
VGSVPEPEVLRADGLVLQPFTEADVDRLSLAFSDPDIQRWNPGPQTTAEVREWMDSRNDWSADDHASWAVSDSDDALLGSVSIHRIDADQADAEIGYWVAPWARGRRVGAQSVTLAVDYAFAQLQLHRIYLFHAVDNVASCRVATAAGFRLEGELRQSHRYADGRYHDEHLHARLAAD